MKKGIITSITFFSIGFVITFLSYLIYGHPYIHAPAIYHIVFFLTLLLGLVWTVYSIFRFFFIIKSEELKWIIITNSLIVIGVIIYIIFKIKP